MLMHICGVCKVAIYTPAILLLLMYEACVADLIPLRPSRCRLDTERLGDLMMGTREFHEAEGNHNFGCLYGPLVRCSMHIPIWHLTPSGGPSRFI